MNELNGEIMKALDELQMMRYRQKVNAEKRPQADRYGFPYEPFDAFSTEPLGFLETAVRLQTEANELFRTIRITHRHSPLYLKMSRRLERMIAQLGSCCITKAVLEQQQGEPFRMLKPLTTDWLRGMAAFNFRKSYTAFMESQAFNQFNGTMLDLSVRWAALDKRLEATAEKIEKIRSGKIKIDLADKAASPDKEKTPSEFAEEKAEQAVPFASKAAAFPIDRPAVREAGQNKTEDPLPENTPVRAESELITEQMQSAPEPERTDSGSPDESSAAPIEPGFLPMDFDDRETDDPLPDDEVPWITDDLIRRMTDYFRVQNLNTWPPP